MKIYESKVTQIRILEVEDLDAITVYFSSHKFGCAEVTIKCWDTSWTYYWGSMGCNLKEFFMSADNFYLAKKFLNGSTSEPDYEQFIESYKSKILSLRREGYLNSRESRELFDESNSILESFNEGDKWGKSYLLPVPSRCI